MPVIWTDQGTYDNLRRLSELNRRKIAEELRIAVENYTAGNFSSPNPNVTIGEIEKVSEVDDENVELEPAQKPASIEELIHRLGGD